MSETLSAWREAGLLSALDHRLAATLGRLSGADDESVPLAIALVSQQLRSGHLFLDLRAMRGRLQAGPWEISLADIPTPEAWREALLSSSVAGPPGGATPLILEGDRLYLHRYWDHQDRLARALRARSVTDRDPEKGVPATTLNALFPGLTPKDPLLLAAQASTGPLHIIVGGPGTGKTSAVVRILACWASMALDRGTSPPRVALAAPTGKARARLEEAITQARDSLNVPDSVRAVIPTDAQTIHRLLRWRPSGRPRCRFGVGRPLPIDALIVDEASMVDLAMMRRVFDACPPECRIILLGDPNQLASVEAGAVLTDICRAAEREGSALVGRVTRLQKSYRYAEESGVGQLAQAIVRGDARRAIDICADERFPNASSSGVDGAPESAPWFKRAVQHCAQLPQATSPAEALTKLHAHRVLCAHRRGPLGVEDTNRRIEAALQAQGHISPHPAGHHGQPIIINQNDYSLKVANGDVGVLWMGADGALHAHLPDDEGGLRTIHPSRLPSHSTSWAMTVHKSQGSEFSAITVVLPKNDSPLLSRELLYTGVTRARDKVHIVGEDAILLACVRRRTERSSGLADALLVS